MRAPPKHCEYLSAGDISRRSGKSLATAKRILEQLEREHGPRVVTRRGRKRVTTEAALASVHPDLALGPGEQKLQALTRMAHDTELRAEGQAADIVNLRARVTKLEFELREFRQKANEWFKRTREN